MNSNNKNNNFWKPTSMASTKYQPLNNDYKKNVGINEESLLQHFIQQIQQK